METCQGFLKFWVRKKKKKSKAPELQKGELLYYCLIIERVATIQVAESTYGADILDLDWCLALFINVWLCPFVAIPLHHNVS